MSPLELEQLVLGAAEVGGGWCTCGDGVLDATDIFCGAGGSSLGLEHVLCPRCGGRLIKVTQALNHWDLAVQAHNANFPDADHDVHDVEQIPASRFRRTPLLWASPSCGHHAYCRGPKDNTEEAMRSRATFNDIVRFTEHHRYDAIIVENVVEARLWCDRRGHPKKCNCGAHFDAWFESMVRLGYDGRVVYFNSQFAIPTPQSRDRMYVVFWRKGIRAPNLDFAPVSWCTECQTVVRGIQTWKTPSRGSLRAQPGKYEWGRYGAQYIYTCPNEDCRAPVAPAVTPALEAIDWSIPAGPIGDRPKPLAEKTRARIKTGLQRLATTQPVQIHVGGNLYERPGYARVWSVRDPLRTVTGSAYMGLVVPGKSGTVPTASEEPMGAITSRPHLGVVVRAGGQEGGKGKPVEEPLNTITAHDRQMAVVVPNREHATGADVDAPMGAITTAPAQHMLVQVARGQKSKNENRTRDAELPMPTVAGHGNVGVVALRNHGGVEPADVPARTVTGGGYHHGLLVYNGSPGHMRDPRHEPVGTVTGRDKQSILVPYYSSAAAGKPVDEPMGTVTSKDRQALVISEADIDACLFRMLQWPELMRAQMMHAHPDGRPYELTARRRDKRGNFRELSNELRVKMIGNAVSAPVATMLGHAVVDVLRSAEAVAA